MHKCIELINFNGMSQIMQNSPVAVLVCCCFCLMVYDLATHKCSSFSWLPFPWTCCSALPWWLLMSWYQPKAESWSLCSRWVQTLGLCDFTSSQCCSFNIASNKSSVFPVSAESLGVIEHGWNVWVTGRLCVAGPQDGPRVWRPRGSRGQTVRLGTDPGVGWWGQSKSSCCWYQPTSGLW